MESLKTKLDDLVYIIKKENPNANWKNLATGLGILFLVAVFSIWYFRDSVSTKQDDFLDELRRNGGLAVPEDFTVNGKGTGSVLSGSDDVDSEGMVVVQKGEGLWHVAKRVCGDGEDYKYLAQANGLNIHWARLAEGQKLKVDCGDSQVN